MKKMVCEICGESNIVKNGDVFICSSCNCQYSLDAAKKLLQEVEDDGSAPQPAAPATAPSQNDNLIISARNAFATGDSEKAKGLYDRVLETDPENGEATLYSAICAAYKSSVNDARILQINKTVDLAFEYSRKNLGTGKEYLEYCVKASKDLSDVILGLINLYTNFYKKAKPTTFGITAAIATANIKEDVKNTYKVGIINCDVVLSQSVLAIIKGVEDFSGAPQTLWKNLETMIKNARISFANMKKIVEPPSIGNLQEIDNADSALKNIETQWNKEYQSKAKLIIEHGKEPVNMTVYVEIDGRETQTIKNEGITELWLSQGQHSLHFKYRNGGVNKKVFVNIPQNKRVNLQRKAFNFVATVYDN